MFSYYSSQRRAQRRAQSVSLFVSLACPLQRAFLVGLCILCTSCVVKEDLNNTYNQAHLGLNEWSLKIAESGGYTLAFDAGYLIGLIDDEGIQSISWTYELMTKEQEVIAFHLEEMRPPSLDKTEIFVEGRRGRVLETNQYLSEGQTYILWFTLRYRDEILHEQLFALVAGEEGGNPNWIEELIGEQVGELPPEITMMSTEAAMNGEDIGPISQGSSPAE